VQAYRNTGAVVRRLFFISERILISDPKPYGGAIGQHMLSRLIPGAYFLQ
jgi:hypothetical protein